MSGLRVTGRRAFDAVLDSDVLVVGTGVAGLSAALGAAPARVAVLTKTDFGIGGSSTWAQGGVAAAIGPDDDPALHAQDTVAVGVGLNDVAAVQALTSEGPERVRELIALGTQFDRDEHGHLLLGREAAHSRRRIVHANGDATGAEIVRSLSVAVGANPSVTVHARTTVLDLVRDGDRVVGLVALHPDGRLVLHRAPAVVVATGGCGRLYKATTNPVEATADGLALAARVGVVLRDLEFVQFHPTALATGDDPMPLVTEALRGEGAALVDETGERFMLAVHPDGELAPRDVVARGIWAHLAAGHLALLDARTAVGDRFPTRFPTVFAACMERGLDPRVSPIPVSPAAHFHMGGIATDMLGRSSLEGLWACGEVASTGVHGANRLASNSLLEGLVFGARVASDIWHAATVRPVRGAALLPVDAALSGTGGHEAVAELRRVMWEQVGLVREAVGMANAVATLDRLAASAAEVLSAEAANLLLAARMVARAAGARPESRGAHYRSDAPATDPVWAVHLEVRLDEAGAITVQRAGALEPAGAA